jgi:hypothetical protein
MAKQETKQSDFRITKALQQTLEKNKLLKEVYFSEEGEHYFSKYTIKVYETNEMNQTTDIKTVESLPGAKMGVVMVQTVLNGVQTWKPARKNISYNPVAATFTRDEVLKAIPVSDIKTEKEKLEILRAAAEIAKDDNIQDLLNKINKQ